MPTEMPPLQPLPPIEQVQQVDSSILSNEIGQQESGGEAEPYKAYNPTSYGAENPALGRYQTLWTTANEAAKRHGVQMPATMQEYLNDPRKQDEIMGLLTREGIEQAKEGLNQNDPRYLEKIVRKVAMIHYGGPGNMDLWDDTRPQYGGPSGREYTENIWRNYLTGSREVYYGGN